MNTNGKSEAFPTMVDAALAIEKVRVSLMVRKSHLALAKRECVETNNLLERTKGLEKYIDGRIANILKSHPAYHWFGRVKGIGRENIAKVIGLVDIEVADTVSSLWAFCGYAPDPETGKAMKREKGKKLRYNSQLRSMCWRLGGSLLKAKGKYYGHYKVYKLRLQERFESEGKTIVPTAKLPKKDGKYYEPENMISEGHIHNMALRKMIKLFLAHLWIIWRQSEGLPTRQPYAMDRLQHTTIIDPWDMVDR